MIAVFVPGDVAIAGQLIAHRALAPSPVATQGSPKTATHPCNHGYYVSQAAHAKKGGAAVSGVAKGKLGKNGDCTAKPSGG